MARLMVDVGTEGRDALAVLKPCEQLFLERWFQLLNDQTHPRWALRPLAVGNLSGLYPSRPSSRNGQLFNAVEDELLRRVITQEPDAARFAHSTRHPAPVRSAYRTAGCSTCRAILAKATKDRASRLEKLVEQLLAGIDAGRSGEVLMLTSVVAAEAIAAGVSPRFMLQTSKNYVLDPRQEKKGLSFGDRLSGFLLHDVGRRPRPGTVPPAGACTLRREMDLKIPSGSLFLASLGSKSIGWLELEKPEGQASRRLWLSLKDVTDLLSGRESAAMELRALTPAWLAALRFIFPDKRVHATSVIERVPAQERPIECPGHRNTFSHREAGRGLGAIASLIEHDDVRASLYWLSLAYGVWGESASHAAGIVWMAIESLMGKSDLGECANAYLRRLPSQIADDLEETLAGLAGTYQDRAKGKRTPPSWVSRMPPRGEAADDSGWLLEVRDTARSVGGNPLFLEMVDDAVTIATSRAHRDAIKEQTVIDLGLLRASRHAVAHSGKAISEEPLAHYLATLGCECLRALLAERLEGTSFEGALEGRPVIAAHCSIEDAHWHMAAIPAWVRAPKGMTVISASHLGHVHVVPLDQEQVRSVYSGSSVTVTSTSETGHAHDFTFQKETKADDGVSS